MREERRKTLGGNIVPSNYRLTFDTDLKSFKYSGTAIIEVRIKNPTKIVKLNAYDLKIKNAKIIAGGSVQIARHMLNQKEEVLKLLVDKAIAGSATIEIHFVGTNADKLYGFYRSSYEREGQKRYILTTQFEPEDARAAFPCFDEPEFKATFDVTLIVDKTLMTISNMPVKSIRKSWDRKVVTFYTTPKMSTYLLYLGIGEFEELSISLNKLKISALTTPGKKRLAKLSLGYAKEFIIFYERYFGINYPLPKIDLLAIPDFAAGAMENWGAITFRETKLLGDEKSSVETKQIIAMDIAHELAHQWFGNLVTMKWWDDLWLNESFAEYLSYKALDVVFPEWNIRSKYLEEVIGAVFAVDEVESTHPISVRVDTPEQVGAIFDRISYDKGSMVLHMLESYAGKEVFRRGLHNYLRRNEYGSATKYDLWNAIDDEAKKEGKHLQIVKFVSHWIENAGYPIIDVAKKNGGFELSQRRFTLSDVKNLNRAWPIPLHYILEKDSKERSLFMNKKNALINANNSNWLKLNHEQDYLYRVRYPSYLLTSLGELIRRGKLNAIDAWGVENDLFVLARMGRVEVEDYLDFIKSYCLEVDYPLNVRIALHLTILHNMLFETSKFDKLRTVALEYFRNALNRLGWCTMPGEPSTATAFRGRVISNLGLLDDKATISYATVLFDRFIDSSIGIDPNIRLAVYSLSARVGDENRFDEIVRLYKKESIPDEKIRLLQSLAMFKTDRLVRRALDFSLSKDVRIEDSFLIPLIMKFNPASRKYLWSWTKSNWKKLMKIYSSSTLMLPKYIDNLEMESSIKTKSEIEEFFSNEKNVRDDIKIALGRLLERINANINFMRKNGLMQVAKLR